MINKIREHYKSIINRPGGNNMSALGFGSFKSISKNNLTSNPSINNQLHLSIELNDECNLNCTHCLYDENLKRQPMPDDLLLKRLSELIDAGIRPTYFTFAGKEPLIFTQDNQSKFQKICKLMADPKTIRIIMTNGLLLDKQLSWLPEYIDCIDISLDGDETTHNRNRRKPGAFTQTWENICRSAEKFKEIGIIATAMTSTIDGIIALQQRLADTFDPNSNVGLSLSLYYDKPENPDLLTEEQLINLFNKLKSGPFPVRVLWTANYAHMTDIIMDAIGCDDSGYDELTGLPLLTSGSLEFVTFNLLVTPTVSLRIAIDGKVYDGCNYLTYGNEASWSAVGDITNESLAEIYQRVKEKTKFIKIPEPCQNRECTALCRGGDLSTGNLQNHKNLDPYCNKIKS